MWEYGPECNTLTDKDKKDAVSAKKSPKKASKKVTKKAVAKKPVSKKTAVKKTVAKKAAPKKAAVKKVAVKKVAVKRRAVPKREVPIEAPKETAKKAAPKKVAAKKAPAGKAAPKKTPAQKAVKKTTAKNAPVKKVAAKRKAVPKRDVPISDAPKEEALKQVSVKDSVQETAPEQINDSQDKATSKGPKVTFKELGLMPEILKALEDVGYTHPTPIQAESIKAALERKDVLGIAQTGTGKTGAFTLPIIQSLAKGRARARMPRCLIVCPTRELAAQVAENVELYSKYLKISMALLIGGVSFAKQEALLNRGVDVLIATPGRLLDHFGRGKVMLNGVEALVVDEADRMLDMGFIPDIEEIFKLTPFTRQVLFFSATMAPEIQRLVDQFLHQPHVVKIARKNITAKTVKQLIVRMPGNDSKQKRTTLRYVIDNNDVKSGIVFCNRKRDVDIVAKSLTVHGHNAAPIHGDLRQSQRMETLAGFKNGDIEFLVASDVAARGLDIPDVSHVFNFDVPSHSEDYVHRIGRTGRAGRKGTAIMFVTPSDKGYYQDILTLINFKEIEEMDIPGIADFATTSRRHGKSSGGRGKQGGRSRNNSNRGRSNNNSSSSSRSKGRNTNRPQENKNAEQGANKQVDIKQTENKQIAKQPNKPVNKSAKTAHKPHQKQTQNRPQGNNKPQQRRGRKGDLPKNNKSGFGDSMPAFFGGDD